MSLKVASVERQEMLDLASLSIERAARDGGMMAVDVEAYHILDMRPDSRMSFEELRTALARLAVSRGVGVEFGRKIPREQNAPGEDAEGA